MRNLWLFAVAGVAFLVCGVVLIMIGSGGSLIFGIPLVFVGLVCIVLTGVYRGKSAR
jgi:drug/metabolite transporter (DMT)-like permease